MNLKSNYLLLSKSKKITFISLVCFVLVNLSTQQTNSFAQDLLTYQLDVQKAPMINKSCKSQGVKKKSKIKLQTNLDRSNAFSHSLYFKTRLCIPIAGYRTSSIHVVIPRPFLSYSYTTQLRTGDVRTEEVELSNGKKTSVTLKVISEQIESFNNQSVATKTVSITSSSFGKRTDTIYLTVLEDAALYFKVYPKLQDDQLPIIKITFDVIHKLLNSPLKVRALIDQVRVE